MNNGWIKSFRKAQDHPIWADKNAWRVFQWIIWNVDYNTGKGTFGRKQIASGTGLKEPTVYKVTTRLHEKYQALSMKSNNQFTEISVSHWARYQQDVQEVTPSRREKYQVADEKSNTIKEYKNKEVKNNDKSLQKVEFGNQDINFLISYMKEKLGLPLLDESVKTNRNYANLCIKKFGLDKTKLAIDATAQSKFWHTKITSYKGLYYNAVKIVSSNRGEVRSVDATKVLVSKNEGREGISTNAGGVSDIKRNFSGGFEYGVVSKILN